MLGAELRRGRRRLSSSLQVPPWKPLDRARSPEPDSVQRPTTLPLRIPPRIAITHAEPDRRQGGWGYALEQVREWPSPFSLQDGAWEELG
ncbi:unnamed protein product [Caretta caretta]